MTGRGVISMNKCLWWRTYTLFTQCNYTAYLIRYEGSNKTAIPKFRWTWLDQYIQGISEFKSHLDSYTSVGEHLILGPN